MTPRPTKFAIRGCDYEGRPCVALIMDEGMSYERVNLFFDVNELRRFIAALETAAKDLQGEIHR